jgi:hypothetical protein
MHTTIYIDIRIQTSEGPQRFARFDLGHDRDAGRRLFSNLKGSREVNSKDMLYIELVESVNELPVNLEILSCDLQQLGTNTMLITQEIFRLTNLRVRKE